MPSDYKISLSGKFFTTLKYKYMNESRFQAVHVVKGCHD